MSAPHWSPLSIFALVLLVWLSVSNQLPVSTDARSAEEWKSNGVLAANRLLRPRPIQPRRVHRHIVEATSTRSQLTSYSQSLGCDVIWISPVVANAPDGFHGY